MRLKILSIIFLSTCGVTLWCAVETKQYINLADKQADFILEAKQIIIPQFPGAFNASIVEWKGEILLLFRVRDEKGTSTFQIGLVKLDSNFNPISEPYIVEITGTNPSTYAQNQDPRLIVIQNKLYILYSNFIAVDSIVTRRMFLAELTENNNTYTIHNPVCLHPFEKWSERWEKNWVPFEYQGNLLLAYSLSPHRIFKPNVHTGECTTECTSTSAITWNWGELRGGTQATLIDNHYLAFFHSSTYLATVHSQGKKMQHYIMGAYLFSPEPPFEITHISQEPIVGDHFYDPPYHNTWKPLRVVFPMSYIVDKEQIWLTYGRQDFEIWVAKIDIQKLYSSLLACSLGKAHITTHRSAQSQEYDASNDLYYAPWYDACENS